MKRTVTNLLWYALHVRLRMEKVVARKLQAEGYESFLPLRRNAGWLPDRSRRIDVPLFPGYVFCRFSLCDSSSLLTRPGVLTIAGVGAGPMPVESHQMESIRKIIESGVPCELWRFPEVGHLTTIESGPFAGVRGIILKSVHRLVVPIPSLQRSISVEMDRDGVMPLRRFSPRNPRYGKTVAATLPSFIPG